MGADWPVVDEAWCGVVWAAGGCPQPQTDLGGHE